MTSRFAGGSDRPYLEGNDAAFRPASADCAANDSALAVSFGERRDGSLTSAL
jgi:hypothetical protein